MMNCRDEINCKMLVLVLSLGMKTDGRKSTLTE